METLIRNRKSKKYGYGLRKNNDRKKTGNTLTPGKTIEQIQAEAVRRLREIGIVI